MLSRKEMESSTKNKHRKHIPEFSCYIYYAKRDTEEKGRKETAKLYHLLAINSKT